MGLGFTIHTKIKDIEKFQQAVESQAVESGYNAEHDESSSTVSFCRLGDLFLNYQHEGEGNTDNVISVNGDCQTNMLGPGFHKAAIEFIDRLQQATGTRFEVEDETDYYTERDFEAMKKKHFHKWLAKLFEIIQEQEDKGSTSLSICWDLNKYYPQSDSGIVISPLGSFRLSEVIRRIREEGIESFADDFFIWNNPERDARFHRGLALNAMWEDCYFMPSERSEEDARINGYIISELETAASLDPSLPFPKKEYEELCRLHGCTPVPTDGIPTYETEFAIGYRRGIINHKVGRIRFSLPGSYLEDTDDGTLVYYDAAADNWHTVRCTGYSTNGEPDFLDVEEEMIEEREFDGGKYRLYDMGIGQDSEDEEPYPVYSCHALCSNQYTLFTLCASRLEDLKKLSGEFLPTLVADQPIEPENKQIIYTGENMNDELMKQIDEWHKAEKHQEIIDALEQIPEAERDFETTSLLARAYNNIEEYAKAAELLESIREAGESQAGWNKRMAYAYQYLVEQEEKAIEYAKRWAELDPEDSSAVAVINECNEELEKRKIKCESCCDDDNGDNKSIAPEMYSEDEIDIIEKHIEHYYGNFEFVFHEKVSPDIHVDICLIPPSEECNWYTLVTMGMGAHLMNVPNQLKEEQLERAELVICLPEYWKLDKEHLKDEKWYWPIRLLKELARFPGENNTWLGWGHTVSYDGPLSYTTELCASILINPPCGNVGGNTCTLPDGEEVNFYQVIPLYRDELEYKLKNGTQKLLDKMNDNILLVNPHRLNVLNQIDIETNPIQSSEISISSVARQEVIAHIEKYFGKINNFLHDDSCSEYPLDIAVIAPRKEHNYYTLITVNMSNHEVLESDDIDGNTCHQELLINLPPDWKLGLSDWTEEKWCWPIRLITSLARQCIRHRTCISWGKTMELGGENTFSEDTKLCAIVLLSPSIFGDKSSTCKTQEAGSVEFYQVIPLYREELQFIQDKDIDEFFEICPDDALETINPLRLNVVTDAEKIGYDISYIDDAKKHEEKIEELHLSADELAPYNHMAIYLRWCIEHNLMSQPFLFRHGDLVDRVKVEDSIDLREFIRDNEDLHGGLSTILLNRVGTMFTKWYNWENRSTPYAYIKDIQAYAMDYFKGRIWNSEDETDAAYLLLPWTEKYYHDMAALIDSRFKEWEDEPQTDPQFLHIPQDNIKLLLKDWSKAIECTVSSRVLVDGCEIATCIRQKPFAEDMGWDSGWLFLADGDEDNDECRYEYCDLNTICNYSPDVMQYLDFPYDTRLVRKEDGKLYVDED